jgi:hypothetical protein
VLSAVRDDIAELEAQLGTQDRQRLQAHLQSVSELEGLIAATPPACQFPDVETEQNTGANGAEDLWVVNEAMSRLIAYAFACDITRVASNLFCSVASESVFWNTGAPSTHHVHSHSSDQAYHDNIVFIMECLARLMQILHETEDATGGNLLDSTIIFASSELSQGWTHSWQRQPIIVGGHGRGWLRHPGIHHQAVAPTSPGDDQTAAGNATDVLLAIARAFDPAHPSIGAGPPMSTTPLAAILA